MAQIPSPKNKWREGWRRKDPIYRGFIHPQQAGKRCNNIIHLHRDHPSGPRRILSRRNHKDKRGSATWLQRRPCPSPSLPFPTRSFLRRASRHSRHSHLLPLTYISLGSVFHIFTYISPASSVSRRSEIVLCCLVSLKVRFVGGCRGFGSKEARRQGFGAASEVGRVCLSRLHIRRSGYS